MPLVLLPLEWLLLLLLTDALQLHTSRRQAMWNVFSLIFVMFFYYYLLKISQRVLFVVLVDWGAVVSVWLHSHNQKQLICCFPLSRSLYHSFVYTSLDYDIIAIVLICCCLMLIFMAFLCEIFRFFQAAFYCLLVEYYFFFDNVFQITLTIYCCNIYFLIF